ncbi:MAG TPA: M1 family metallopeptidase [Pyrinomonadaceae bacterium]|nr:M1 family metallopeptidase [Pyrinomonadaceae bacterium]
MEQMRRFCFLLLLSCVGAVVSKAEAAAQRSFDVLHYEARVEPDIAQKTVAGEVRITLVSRADKLTEVEFDCGELTITAVRHIGEDLKFTRSGDRLKITLSRPAKAGEWLRISVEYRGTPRHGIRFFPEREQTYTAFSTSQWMVCVDAPEDRATLRLVLILPSKLKAVANGRLVSSRAWGEDKTAYEWMEEKPVPTYTYGFAAGPFRELTERKGQVLLRYLAAPFSDQELRSIFGDTADMIRFFEERAGVRYAARTYTQVLAERGYGQEMSDFAVMGENYGRDVLAKKRDLWLSAHELAHQWWGNMVTCVSWSHFWLNEGIATFMANAYKERRFGREAYLREVEDNRKSYERVRDAGHDKSLVFPDWSNPTADDRTLVYDKGAYVIHLLREELGERAFWKGLRQYTRAYFGKSVTTADFQAAMERASGKNLSEFFNKWVYLKSNDE